MIRIVPLSKQYLEQAIDVTQASFQNKREENEMYLTCSLNPEMRKRILGRYGCDSLRYWAAVQEEQVIGMMGFYTLDIDKKDTIWGIGFCVDEKFRGRGIGSRLLDLAIETARIENYTWFNIPTENSPLQATAQRLYDQKKFQIYAIRDFFEGTIWFRTLNLKEEQIKKPEEKTILRIF